MNYKKKFALMLAASLAMVAISCSSSDKDDNDDDDDDDIEDTRHRHRDKDDLFDDDDYKSRKDDDVQMPSNKIYRSTTAVDEINNLFRQALSDLEANPQNYEQIADRLDDACDALEDRLSDSEAEAVKNDPTFRQLRSQFDDALRAAHRQYR